MTYPINCARCGIRRVFRSVERLARWVKSHRCWETKHA